MIRTFILALVALNILASCATTGKSGSSSNEPYQPITKPEKVEFAHDHLDVYPDDIRKNLGAHTNAAVVWTGIIRCTDARELDTGNKIEADTVLEHHYFDWVQNGKGKGAKFSLSPRGEGQFKVRWTMKRTSMDSSYKSAERFAGRGKLAIVYGVPEKVDTNGAVELKYRYLRIVDCDQYNTNEFDYGRLGDSFRVISHDCQCKCKSK